MIRVLLLLVLGGGSLLRADALRYIVQPVSGGFSYQFTLTNSGDTGGTLFDLFLSIATDISTIDTSTVGTPPGWGDPSGGLLFFGPDVNPSTSFIEWAADFSGAFDLGMGGAMSGFSFTTAQPVGTPIRFALNGSTSFADAQPTSAVPEPGGLALLTGAAILVWLRRPGAANGTASPR